MSRSREGDGRWDAVWFADWGSGRRAPPHRGGDTEPVQLWLQHLQFSQARVSLGFGLELIET